MNVKDRKYSAWFLPKLSLDLLHQVLLWSDLQSLRSKNFIDTGFRKVYIVGYLGHTLEMRHIAQFIQIREKET